LMAEREARGAWFGRSDPPDTHRSGANPSWLQHTAPEVRVVHPTRLNARALDGNKTIHNSAGARRGARITCGHLIRIKSLTNRAVSATIKHARKPTDLSLGMHIPGHCCPMNANRPSTRHFRERVHDTSMFYSCVAEMEMHSPLPSTTPLASCCAPKVR
jgi:hypothetical protein